MEKTELFKQTKALAKQGYADAQSVLGFIYKKGDVIEKDFQEASKWFKKAADQGHSVAKKELLNREDWY